MKHLRQNEFLIKDIIKMTLFYAGIVGITYYSIKKNNEMIDMMVAANPEYWNS